MCKNALDIKSALATAECILVNVNVKRKKKTNVEAHLSRQKAIGEYAFAHMKVITCT